MKKNSYLIALLFALSPLVEAKDADSPNFPVTTEKVEIPYFDPATVQVKDLLPDPPAVGSPETQKELALILKDQAARTPEEVARIKEAVHPTVWLFKNVLGSWYTKETLPVTAKLFARVDADEHPIVDSAKDLWSRPRPPQQDSRVHPPIDLPKNASYPSGHSSFAMLTALILAELAPDQKEAILARGRQIGDDRIIAGVHFPSDVAEGRVLAQAIFTKLMASPDFQADLAKAKAEIAAARAKA